MMNYDPVLPVSIPSIEGPDLADVSYGSAQIMVSEKYPFEKLFAMARRGVYRALRAAARDPSKKSWRRGQVRRMLFLLLRGAFNRHGCLPPKEALLPKIVRLFRVANRRNTGVSLDEIRRECGNKLDKFFEANNDPQSPTK